MNKATIDPKLTAALKTANQDDRLNVFVKVSHETAADVTARRNDAMRVAQRVTNSNPLVKAQYRELDDVLHVVATRDVLAELINQPDVVAVTMAPQFRSALIAPIETKDVDESAISRPVRLRRSKSPTER